MFEFLDPFCEVAERFSEHVYVASLKPAMPIFLLNDCLI